MEVENIHNLLGNGGLKSRSYLADEAHERQLKSIGSTDILHIATHGFFEGSSEDLINDDPLLHSGLLMANLRESIDPNEENGIAVLGQEFYVDPIWPGIDIEFDVRFTTAAPEVDQFNEFVGFQSGSSFQVATDFNFEAIEGVPETGIWYHVETTIPFDIPFISS